MDTKLKVGVGGEKKNSEQGRNSILGMVIQVKGFFVLVP